MGGWLRQATGGLPREFWYLWTGTLVNRLGAFVVPFLAIYLTTARGFSASYAGLVLGLYGVGGAAGTLLGGVLADRWGRRPTLLLSHFGGATFMVTLGLLRDRYAIMAGVVLLGVTAEMARPAFSAMIADVVPHGDRLRAFTLNYWAINLGFASAAIVAGFAARGGYLLLFLGDAGTTLVTATIVLTRVREPRRAAAERRAAQRRAAERRIGQSRGGRRRAADAGRAGRTGAGRTGAGAGSRVGLRAVFADRIFLGFVALNVLSALIFMQHLSTLPMAMERDGLSPATYGTVIALNGILIVGGQLFVPRLVRGRDRSRVLALAAVIVGVGFGLTAVAHSPRWYALTVLVWTLGEMLNSPSNSTLISELSPVAMRGRYQGVFSLSWQVASILAPVLGGLVAQHLGTAWVWLGCAGVGGAIALAQLASGPARERRAGQLRHAEALIERHHLPGGHVPDTREPDTGLAGTGEVSRSLAASP